MTSGNLPSSVVIVQLPSSALPCQCHILLHYSAKSSHVHRLGSRRAAHDCFHSILVRVVDSYKLYIVFSSGVPNQAASDELVERTLASAPAQVSI